MIMILGVIKELLKNIRKEIFFYNSHSYPICEKWLQLMKYKDDNTLIGTSASNESLINSISLKKPYKIFSYLFKKSRLKKFLIVFLILISEHQVF